jgi:hypothetical protein
MAKQRPKSSRPVPAPAGKPSRTRRQCGLCGKTGKLTKTPCCGNWICDDEDQYVLFSYARNSCYRNHDHYTLCASHFREGHPGKWQDCPKCRESFNTEMYVWYATNEYNFETLKEPPAFEPTHCKQCGVVIRLGEDGYSTKGGDYLCMACTAQEFPELYGGKPRKRRG